MTAWMKPGARFRVRQPYPIWASKCAERRGRLGTIVELKPGVVQFKMDGARYARWTRAEYAEASFEKAQEAL